MGMDQGVKKIAVICNYQLLPERVGGMDYFFWRFDQKCKENSCAIDWFFPNKATHGDYNKLNIYSSDFKNVEHYFLNHHVQNEYDYIIMHFVELCTPTIKKIKEHTKAQIIMVDHNPRPLLGYSVKKKIEKRTKGLLYARYIDLFVGVSEYTCKEIIKDFGNQLKSKTKVIYNGVITDDILIRNNRNLEHPNFLVVSHLRKSKGIQDLIEALHLIPSEIVNEINIDIYGDGLFKDVLVEKVKKYQLENTIHFKGSVSNLKTIYCNYDYLLQPTHMECFSLSILESLAANVPVITTAVGGNEEAVKNGENGLIFKAKDIKQLSKIMVDVTTGKIKITENTRTKIENHFSIEKMINAYFELLN